MSWLKARLVFLCYILLLAHTDSTASTVQSPSAIANTQTTSSVSPYLLNSPVKTCDKNCENGGICRLVNASGTLAKHCFCRPDYKGRFCENDSVPPLTKCTEATCKNRGRCVGSKGAPSCQCPPGVVGRTCERRMRIFSVAVLLTANKDAVNSDYYQNYTIQKWRNLACILIHRAFEEGDNPHLIVSFHGCLPTQIRDYTNTSLNNRPVTASVELKLDYTNSMAALLTEDAIRNHLITGATYLKTLNHTALNVSHIMISELSLSAVDPCVNGNNDCSQYANCTSIAPGLYTCTCSAFAIDTSVDPLYPGRKCIYDGLIIFSCFITGILLSLIICLAFGCRRTVWHRLRRHGDGDKAALIGMPSNYQI